MFVSCSVRRSRTMSHADDGRRTTDDEGRRRTTDDEDDEDDDEEHDGTKRGARDRCAIS